MGLLGAIGSGLAEVGGAVKDIGLTQVRSAIEEERQARMVELQSQTRMRDEATTRDMNKADAAEERGRIQTEAQGMADKRGGLLSQSATDAYTNLASTDPAGSKAGLDAVASAKASGGYVQDPTIRDMLMAKGDYSGVAMHEDKAADNIRADRKMSNDEAHQAEEMKLRKAELNIRAAAEGRMAKGTNLENEIKQITLDNAKRVNVLKDEFKGATPERRAQITEEVQLLTGKDNDSYLPLPTKDDLGNVTGYKIFDKKRGTWVEPQGQSQGKTATAEQVEAYAKQKGVSVDVATKALASAGWSVSGSPDTKGASGNPANKPAADSTVKTRKDTGLLATNEGKDFRFLEKDAAALDDQLAAATKRMNSPQANAPGVREKLQAEMVDIAKRRNEVERQMNALRSK